MEWVEEMEVDIKDINKKINKKRKQVEDNIDQLKLLYLERERIIDKHLEVSE